MGDAVPRTTVDVFMIRHHGKLEVISLHFNLRDRFYGCHAFFIARGLTRNGLNIAQSKFQFHSLVVGFEPQVLTQTFWCGGDFDLEERLARRKEQSGKERNS